MLINASHDDALQALKASNGEREYADLTESMGGRTMGWTYFDEAEDDENLQTEMAEEGYQMLESEKDMPQTAEFIKSRNQLN